MIAHASIPFLDASSWLHAFGPWVLVGIAVVIFIESGVLFPFLPGDSLLITAAILAPQLGIQVWQIAVVAVVAAFLGDQTGYWIGKRFGRGLFKPDARVLKTERLKAAEAFFAKYGGPSLVLGRFVPFVRTYVPLSAGIAAMPYRRFLLWNALGGVSWVIVMVVVGVLLGGIPFIANNIDVLMIVVVVLSIAPIAISALRRRRVRARTSQE
ncbi:VTT domain-containing protein [Leifsonia sp. fls2-241-R2A-40a]|uniref:DedA family protein n=1 Tax=Leifsonia sp. fls2-241-R2A-40a TaxID=3040290 RepID=UPI00254F4FFF|nr:VTT domain-containing protein [Leifsonia sp. fls2-241-R2A-40a]